MQKLDPALNTSFFYVSGCLIPTNVNCLYTFAGAVHPDKHQEDMSRDGQGMCRPTMSSVQENSNTESVKTVTMFS